MTAGTFSASDLTRIASRYQLGAELAKGALCTVYRGQDLALRRPVAIKAVPGEHIATYRRALEASAAFSHPATICDVDAIEASDHLFLIQELIAKARPLKDYVAQGAPVARALDLVAQVAAAIAYAHSFGVVHGDLTPAAVLVDALALAHINNFGMPADGDYLTHVTDQMRADPALAAMPLPDQASGEAGDVRMLGLLLWSLLAGPVSEGGGSPGRRLRVEAPEPVRALVRAAAGATRFGGPLTTGHTMAESEAFAKMHGEGFYGIVLRGDRVGQIADVLRQLTLSHAFGFFGTSPFMWLGLLALPVALVLRGGRVRARREMIIAHASWLAMMLALFVAISAALNWRGGWVVGPRFFGCAPPLFGFGALCALEGVARRGPAWRTIARAVAVGLAAASALTIGFVSLHFNSVPEEVTRPLAQLSLPLARAGFVPHHIGEVFGVTSPTVWYLVCGCMLALPLVPGLLASGSRPRAYVARLALAAIVFLVGIRPAFTEPDPDEGGDGGVGARCFFAQNWEPVSRDPPAARPSGCP